MTRMKETVLSAWVRFLPEETCPLICKQTPIVYATPVSFRAYQTLTATTLCYWR